MEICLSDLVYRKDSLILHICEVFSLLEWNKAIPDFMDLRNNFHRLSLSKIM